MLNSVVGGAFEISGTQIPLVIWKMWIMGRMIKAAAMPMGNPRAVLIYTGMEDEVGVVN